PHELLSVVVALDLGLAATEPSFDVLATAHEPHDGLLQCAGLAVEVAAIRGDLAGERELEAPEEVNAGREVLRDRVPVGTPLIPGLVAVHGIAPGQLAAARRWRRRAAPSERI